MSKRFFFGSSQREAAEDSAASKPEAEKSEDEPEKEQSPPSLTVEEEQHVKEMKEKISDLKEKLKMAQLDAEQATKRHHQAMEDATKYAHTKMAKGILELSDNLKRVHEAVTPDAAAADARLGEIISDVHRVDKHLKDALKEFGVVEESPMGKKFDPNFHEAMFELPLPHHEPGTVAHVLQTGWLIHERVLRPARVGVVSK
jgi:molecular chaperone GrpE